MWDEGKYSQIESTAQLPILLIRTSLDFHVCREGPYEVERNRHKFQTKNSVPFQQLARAFTTISLEPSTKIFPLHHRIHRCCHLETTRLIISPSTLSILPTNTQSCTINGKILNVQAFPISAIVHLLLIQIHLN